jgi:alpha-N-arabinofuranosidase
MRQAIPIPSPRRQPEEWQRKLIRPGPVPSSGVDADPLDVAAALDADRRALTVAIVNPTEFPQSIRVEFKNIALQDKDTAWQIAASDLQARNLPGREMAVKIVESPLAHRPATMVVAPLSITLYRFTVR